MQWVWEEFGFHRKPFRVAHFEAPGEDRDLVEDKAIIRLDRCEDELGACLWHDTNLATLRVLEEHRPKYDGVRVLELGAGAGTIGIALALDGAAAVITDFSTLVPLMELNVRENGFGDACGGGYSTSSSAPKPVRKTNKKKASTKKRGSDDSSDEDAGEADVVEDSGTKTLSAKQRRAARAAKKSERSIEESSNIGPLASCRTQACDWVREAQEPSLPAGGFDLVVVCDCLYENKESWHFLQAILTRVLAPGAERFLASATLRRPFLEEFLPSLTAEGFQILSRKVTDVAAVVILSAPLPPPSSVGPDASESTSAVNAGPV